MSRKIVKGKEYVLFMLRKGVMVLISLFALLLVMISFANAHAEHAAQQVGQKSVWYQIFLIHDWLHPLAFLLLIYSCYSVRFFSSRHILKEPQRCLGSCSQCFTPENTIKQYHCYFFWITFFLLFVHVGELVPSLLDIFSFKGFDATILFSETAYVGFAFLYLGTCYHFRYALERLAHRGTITYSLYNKVTDMNRHHGTFFWLTIFSVAVRFTTMLITTQSFLKAFPGTF